MPLLTVSHHRQRQQADCLDPEFVRVPQTVSTDLFLLAWLEQDYRYAVIKLAGAA